MFSIAGKIIFPIFAGPLMTEPTNKIYEQDPHSRVPQLSQYAGPQRRHPLRGVRENQKRRGVAPAHPQLPQGRLGQPALLMWSRMPVSDLFLTPKSSLVTLVTHKNTNFFL